MAGHFETLRPRSTRHRLGLPGFTKTTYPSFGGDNENTVVLAALFRTHRRPSCA